MSISSTLNRNDYEGAGTTATYAYGFKITDEDHLQVVVADANGAETELTITTHYTVTGVNASSGGNVVLVGTTSFAWIDTSGFLEDDYSISIRLKLPLTQPTDLRNQGSFLPESIEDALDRGIRIDQQQQDEIDRSMKLPVTVDPADVSVDLPTPSAGKVLAWNSDGDGLENVADLSAQTVTAYMETLLDDTTAAAARTTLDVTQAINSLTEETTPSVSDYVAIRDVSGSADRKMTVSNFLESMSFLTADTTPALTDLLMSYRIADSSCRKITIISAISQSLRIGGFLNLGLSNATTTVTDDSINIGGASAALSATSPLYIHLPHATSPGRGTVLSATADVKIKLTGAHWGFGTFGDQSDLVMRVLAINDGSGTIKFGVTPTSGITTIASTSTSATATDINLGTEVLVNAALAVGTWPCVEIGWFLADFDDTGGSSEDLYVVQSGIGEIQVGTPSPIRSEIIYTTGAGHGSGSTKVRRIETKESVQGSDITVALSSSLGNVYTINSAGNYEVDYTDLHSGAGFVAGVSVNSNQLTTSVGSITAAHRKAALGSPSNDGAHVSCVFRAAAGDVVRPHTDGTATSTDPLVRFSIRKISN